MAQIVQSAKGLPKLALTPLPSKPPTGKSMIILQVPAEAQGVAVVDAAKTAAARLGWTVSALDYAGDPATLSSAFEQAISEKPTAIGLIGVEASTIKPALQQAAKAGILVFDDGSSVAPTGPLPSGNGYAGVIYGPSNYEQEGQLIADWIIEAANGKKVTVAYFTFPVYTVLSLDAQGMREEFAKYCQNCTLKVFSAEIGDIGTKLPQTATAAVQSDPSIGYEIFPFGGVDVGVEAALKTAGESGVQLAVAASLLPSDYQEMLAGTEAVGTNSSVTLQGYMFVDELARYLETGKPVSEEPPNQVFDKTNAPSSGIVSDSEYPAEFTSLWHLSGS